MRTQLENQENMLIFYDRDFKITIKLCSMLEFNPKLIEILKLLVPRVSVPKLPGIISSRLGTSDKIYVHYSILRIQWIVGKRVSRRPKNQRLAAKEQRPYIWLPQFDPLFLEHHHKCSIRNNQIPPDRKTWRKYLHQLQPFWITTRNAARSLESDQMIVCTIIVKYQLKIIKREGRKLKKYWDHHILI